MKGGVFSTQISVCTKCGHALDAKSIAKIQAEIDAQIKSLLQEHRESEEMDYNSQIESLQKLIKQLKTLNPQFAPILIRIVNASLSKQKYKNAYRLLKVYLANFKQWFNGELPLYGWKLNEISKLAFYLGKFQKAEKFTVQALKVLSKYYEQCPEVTELRQRLADIRSEITRITYEKQYQPK